MSASSSSALEQICTRIVGVDSAIIATAVINPDGTVAAEYFRRKLGIDYTRGDPVGYGLYARMVAGMMEKAGAFFGKTDYISVALQGAKLAVIPNGDLNQSIALMLERSADIEYIVEKARNEVPWLSTPRKEVRTGQSAKG